jgi:hypothetical protein
MLSKLNKMKILLNVILILIPFSFISQKQINIIFFVNDSKTTSSELYSFSNMVFLNNKDVKINNFNIYHFTYNKERDTTLTNKKKKVIYKVLPTDCDFSICSSLNTLVPDKKTQKNKFYNCQNSLKCDINKWGISNVNSLSSRSESLLLEKIKEEVALNSIDKTNTTIFFYLTNENNLESKPEVTFEKEQIELKSGQSIQLNPIYSKNIKKVIWTPNESISCIDCKLPSINPTKNIVYTVTASDSLNCHTVSKNISINVVNDCDCNSGNMKPINDVFGKLSIPKYKNDIEIADWQIISNQSGGFVFDVLFTSNCAQQYKLTIEDKNGSVIWEDTFTKEQVDRRARTELHDKYPEYLVFRLTLKSLSKQFEDAENYFKINLFSLDESGVSCQPYKSPKLIFTKCN